MFVLSVANIYSVVTAAHCALIHLCFVLLLAPVFKQSSMIFDALCFSPFPFPLGGISLTSKSTFHIYLFNNTHGAMKVLWCHFVFVLEAAHQTALKTKCPKKRTHRGRDDGTVELCVEQRLVDMAPDPKEGQLQTVVASDSVGQLLQQAHIPSPGLVKLGHAGQAAAHDIQTVACAGLNQSQAPAV